MNRLSALSLVLIVSGPLSAQIAFGGEPMGLQSELELPAAPIAVMPAVDAASMMAEDAAREAEGVKGPYRFGFNHATELSLENSGVWHELPNGDRLWRLSVECPDAYSINFEFHDYVVPEGGKVFVYSDLEMIGAFTMESSGGQNVLGVTQVAGDRITIEYLEPASALGEGRLRIGQVTHAYRDILGLMKGLGDSGSCNNNTICPVGDPWRAQIRSVAMITVGGSGVCTGQLINNCANDGIPYFLTANHCLGGNNTWVFRFNWQSPNCTANQNGPTNQTVSGSSLKVNSAGSDVALLQLNTTPPSAYNVFYTGWDKSGVAPTSSTGIHHPSGDVKKISFDVNAAVTGTFSGAQCWRILNWEDGTTEGGSSGSGLWNQNGLLVGQLFGGAANCGNNVNDFYGKFSVSYPSLSQWLGTCGDQLSGFPSTVGINESTVGRNGLTVAPNPTNGFLNIDLAEYLRNGGQLMLHDALGQIVFDRNVARGTERLTIDLGMIPSGVYVLSLQYDGQRTVKRVIIEH